MVVVFFGALGFGSKLLRGSSFLFEKEKNQKKITGPGVGAMRAPAGAGVIRSFLFRQKGTEKPERHARSGKSPHSPHFRCGRARSRDVGCDWNWPRPACAFPAPKTGFGICLHSATSPVCACRILAAGKGMSGLAVKKGVSRKREELEWLQPRTSLGYGGRCVGPPTPNP